MLQPYKRLSSEGYLLSAYFMDNTTREANMSKEPKYSSLLPKHLYETIVIYTPLITDRMTNRFGTDTSICLYLRHINPIVKKGIPKNKKLRICLTLPKI